MAPFLPVRAISRSQAVRIGGQTVKVDSTTYVDLGSEAQPYTPRKELRSHLALGAVIVVGPLTASNSNLAVATGLVTSATKAEEPEVSTTAGEFRNRNTGVSVVSAALAGAKKKVAAAGKERIDIVIVNEKTGVAKYEAGTAALEKAAVAPATPAESFVIATVTFTATAEVATVVNLNRE